MLSVLWGMFFADNFSASVAEAPGFPTGVFAPAIFAALFGAAARPTNRNAGR